MLCTKCGENKDVSCFRERKELKRGYTSWCRSCENIANRKRYVKHPRARVPQRPYNRIDAKSKMLKHRYGITFSDLTQIYEVQGGKCVICFKPRNMLGKNGLYVDHNHKTNKIRGLLCPSCNMAIGHFKEDQGIMERAIKYLYPEWSKQ